MGRKKRGLFYQFKKCKIDKNRGKRLEAIGKTFYPQTIHPPLPTLIRWGLATLLNSS